MEKNLFKIKKVELQLKQQLEKFKQEARIKKTLTRMGSYALQERFRNNGLEFIIFYMYGTAFTVFPKTKKIENIIQQFQKALPTDIIVNEQIKSKLGDIYSNSLEMLSSKSDKDIVRSLFAMATSSRFTAKLQGTLFNQFNQNHNESGSFFSNFKISNFKIYAWAG